MNQLKYKCYGSSAAITFEQTTKTDDYLGTVHTLNFDLAKKRASTFDWENKITFQLTFEELPLLAAVFLGYLPSLDIKRSSKGALFERQTGKIFVSVSQGSGNHFVIPIPMGHSYHIATMFLNQLSKSPFGGDSFNCLSSIKGVCALRGK